MKIIVRTVTQIASADRLFSTAEAGIAPEPSYRDRVVRLRPGDRLVLYTGGVTAAPNRMGEEFGYERLFALLEATRARPLGGGLATVLAAIEDWCGRRSFPGDPSMLAVDVDTGPVSKG